MRAVVMDRYGPPEVLELGEVEPPVPGEDQVRIRVRASSLNMADWHTITGSPYLVRLSAGLTRPKLRIPGSDVAGVVDGVGREVTRWKPGDEVFGSAGTGAFAEYVCVAEDHLAAKPSSLTWEQAAAVPMAGLTALQGLRDIGHLESGQKVLVNGASGGVGTFAVQIAKALGAEVTAVCSTSKVDLVASIGADRVIDYTRVDFTEGERDHHLLFDNVGDRPWSQTSRTLAPGGTVVTVTGPKRPWLGPLPELIFRKTASLFSDRNYASYISWNDRDDLEFLAGLLASNQVKPAIEEVYPLDKTVDALRYLGEGHAAGKLVITV